MINNKSEILLSTAYFPPIEYFYEIYNYENIFIEKHENFVKQTYRNRCKIMSSNGIQVLSIPVKKASKRKIIVSKAEIDYKEDWQKQHLKTLETSYKKSPFFEFYIDSILHFFTKKYKYLFDFNTEILNTLLFEMQIENNIKFTKEFNLNSNSTDLRNKIHPKKESNLKFKEYTQVFFYKFKFYQNLSILDLLFNEGPNSYSFF